MSIIAILSQIKTVLDSIKYLQVFLKKKYIHFVIFVAIILGGFYYFSMKIKGYEKELKVYKHNYISLMYNVDFWYSHRQISEEICDIAISCGKGYFVGWLIMDLSENKLIAYSLKEGRYTVSDGILKISKKMDCTDIIRDQDQISQGMMQRGIKIPPLAQKFQNLDKKTLDYFKALKHKEISVIPKQMAFDFDLKSIYEMYSSSVTDINSATIYPYKVENNTIWIFYIAEDISKASEAVKKEFCSQKVVQRSYLENIAHIAEKTFNVLLEM